MNNFFRRSAAQSLTLLFAALLIIGDTLAQHIAYEDIPQDLLKDANAVVRESNISFTVNAIDAATLHVERTVTVLNEWGDRQAKLAIEYDKQTKIKKISYQVLNAQGEVVQKVKAKDMEDFSNAQGSLYEDNRVKYYQHTSNQYPYTIRYAYDIVYDGLLFYPDWYPQDGYKVSVEQSSFTVTTPKALSFRYKESNIQEKPSVIDHGDQTMYTWKVAQIAAIKAEPWGPSLAKLSPVVWTAPNDFKYEGYQGNMSTWENFGKWVYQLNQGRGVLPEKTIQEVRRLTAGMEDEQLIVKKLYEYMQSRTRYVSIQLGIGGYQPFSATTVDALGYGDCKALSNYMIALLDAVNIPAHYTLVRAGKNAPALKTDFPSTQFNHVIVCVPMPHDTLWLECTSQTDPAGFLGYFTSDRDVLVIDEKGGHLARTPTYTPANNLQSRTASVILDENGNGEASITTLYTGLQYAHVEEIARQSGTVQRSLIYQKTGIVGCDLTGYHYDLLKAALPVAREELSLHLKKYANVNGKRLFFNPNLLNRINFTLPAIAQRSSDIVIHSAYLDVDSISFNIPAHMQLEYLPEAVSIQSKFGEYEAQYVVKEGKLLYVRKFKTIPGSYEAEDYEELRLFYEHVGKADNANVVVKTTT